MKKFVRYYNEIMKYQTQKVNYKHTYCCINYADDLYIYVKRTNNYVFWWNICVYTFRM